LTDFPGPGSESPPPFYFPKFQTRAVNRTCNRNALLRPPGVPKLLVSLHSSQGPFQGVTPYPPELFYSPRPRSHHRPIIEEIFPLVPSPAPPLLSQFLSIFFRIVPSRVPPQPVTLQRKIFLGFNPFPFPASFTSFAFPGILPHRRRSSSLGEQIRRRDPLKEGQFAVPSLSLLSLGAAAFAHAREFHPHSVSPHLSSFTSSLDLGRFPLYEAFSFST